MPPPDRSDGPTDGASPHQPPDASTPDPPGSGFRHLGDELLGRGWRISFVRATFAAPDGTSFTREVVRHPGAVAVVPVTEHGTALLVRQYRGPVDRALLEIPAGTRDVPGEPPEATARRELEEEVGVRAGHLELLATVHNTPGFCDEETLVYLATALEPGHTARCGEEELAMEVVEVALHETDAMVQRGELTDAQSIIGLLLAGQAAARGGARSPSGTGPGSPA